MTTVAGNGKAQRRQTAQRAHGVCQGVEGGVHGGDVLLRHCQLPLAEHWTPSLQAYLGTTVAGFPNLFFMTGPNTGLGHNSMVFMVESQLNYVTDCLRTMRQHGADTFEVRRAVQDAYNEELLSNQPHPSRSRN